MKSIKTYIAIKENFENLPINEIKWPNEAIPESGIFQTDPPVWTAIPILPKERFLINGYYIFYVAISRHFGAW